MQVCCSFHLWSCRVVWSKGPCRCSWQGRLLWRSFVPFILFPAFVWCLLSPGVGRHHCMMLWRFLPSPLLGQMLLHLIYCIRLLLILVAQLKRLWASAHSQIAPYLVFCPVNRAQAKAAPVLLGEDWRHKSNYLAHSRRRETKTPPVF